MNKHLASKDFIGTNDLNVFAALVKAAKKHGFNKLIVIDGDDRKLTYGDILKGSHALGQALSRLSKPHEKIGMLLPTSAGSLVTFFALLAYGRIPAMINFTAGRQAIEAACTSAEVSTILTSRRFVSIANIEPLIAEISQFAKIVYLEDVREKLSLGDKVSALVGSKFPEVLGQRANPDDPCTLLFTSGTEGEPKGVALSHTNIVANVRQVQIAIPFDQSDIFFNPMPIFHSYGLVAGCVLPVLLGNKVILHPSPLQVKQIPVRVHETSATIMIATDTFLRQYARAGEDGSLSSLKYVVCGAERVRPETRQMALDRFDFLLVEGYGVTETSPVLACNSPLDNRPGTVGRALPWIETRLEAVEGIAEGGKLYVRGPNIMMGYLSVDRPGVIVPPKDGWHDTGDIVQIDDEGLITISGRLKRFAKIGGERVSLTFSEAAAARCRPDDTHAAAALPDKQKGEIIVLLTESENLTRDMLVDAAQEIGAPEISIPRHVKQVDEIPLLGNGKVNFGAVNKLAREAFANV